MKNIVIIAFIVIFLFEIVLVVRQNRVKKEIEEKITSSILTEDYMLFYNLIESKDALKYIPFFNRQYLKLNVAFLSKNDTDIINILDSFKNVKMNESQMEEVCLKAFNYFIEKENKNESKYYKNKILSISKNETICTLTKRTYNIYIDKINKDLDELLMENKSLEGKKRASNDLLISKIYENEGNSILSKKFMNQYYEDIAQ